MCGNKMGREQCERNDACEFRSGADADCEYTPTLPMGCCKGLTRKNADMCAEKEDPNSCERSGKCEFIETADFSECEYATTTSEPWLGAKDETLMFGEESIIGDAMNTQVSLSTVLLAVAAALAVLQVYRWCSASSSRDGYTKLATPHNPSCYYQTA